MQFLVKIMLVLFQVTHTLVQLGLCKLSNFDYATQQKKYYFKLLKKNWIVDQIA